MCGILGGNNPKWDYENGIKCMIHRGPDGINIVREKNITLAFARLAIIDLSEKGMQPMYSSDGQVLIVFNGEIYGYRKLRNYLIRKGYRFKSTSDTEVILNAYLEWGDKFISKIDGMYGIAIYDKRDGKIRLFRDRIGIKPLYYFFDGKNFAFSSELKGIETTCKNVRFEVDNTAIYDYLKCLYIPDPKTMYKNVYKLQAGHMLVFDIKKNDIEKDVSYWKLKVNEYQGRQRKAEDIIEEARELIKHSVAEQMVADVPVGTFLSGGIDSSIITYESSKINSEVETFSIGFTDKKFDELKYALSIAERISVYSNSRVYDKKIYEEDFLKIRNWYDEPFADTSAYPTYLVSKLARERVTVVLTGDGGDEVFGGYPRYNMLKKHEENGIDCALCSHVYRALVPNYQMDSKWIENIRYAFQLYAFPLKETDKELRNRLGIPRDYDDLWSVRRYYRKDLPARTRYQYLDIKTYLPGDILTKVDRASMAASLETRVPFLDKRIVEFSFSLSEEDRYLNGELKGILKKAYVAEIGRTIMNRPKMGFSVPTYFYGKSLSPQEEMLKKIWNL